MLMLQLTDGVTHIQGMEYQSIPALHSGLPPGTKILVRGCILFRLGVLLLKPENVKVLGGEVDGLSEENAQEKVLARLIGELDRSSELTAMKASKQDKGGLKSAASSLSTKILPWERSRRALIRMLWGEGLCDRGLQSRSW